MEEKKKLGEKIDMEEYTDITSSARMFPIMNKIDRIWYTHPRLKFCDLIKCVAGNLTLFSEMTDDEFRSKLDQYINDNKIK